MGLWSYMEKAEKRVLAGSHRRPSPVLESRRDRQHGPTPETENASHHMGNTRMHPDPKPDVVDADRKVHGISNLWLAGSSVFPTVGCANPTSIIAVLTSRLIDHLRGILLT